MCLQVYTPQYIKIKTLKFFRHPLFHIKFLFFKGNKLFVKFMLVVIFFEGFFFLNTVLEDYQQGCGAQWIVFYGFFSF